MGKEGEEGQAATAPDEGGGPTLDDALGIESGGDEPTLEDQLDGVDPFAVPGEEEGAEEGGTPEPGQPPAGAEEGEEPTAEGEEPPEGEGEEPAKVRYRDPESGKFITAEEAESRGLDPEELTTEAEAAEEFFGEGEEGGEEEGEEPEVEPLEVSLSEDEALEIEVEDDETREALQAKLDAAERVEQVEARAEELEATEKEVKAALRAKEEFERELEEDPTGFVLNHLPDERRQEIAVELLYDDEVLQAVDEKLDEWSRKPHKREVESERKKRERLEEKDKREKVRAAQRARQDKAEQIMDTLQGMVPEGMGSDLADRFLQDAAEDIRRHIQREEMYPQDFEVEKIPSLIEHRLELYGIDPSEVSSNGRPAGSGVTRAEPRGEEAERLAEEAEYHRQTGERLRKARARRKAAASSAPPGAGSSPARPDIGGDATLGEALDAVERRAG